MNTDAMDTTTIEEKDLTMTSPADHVLAASSSDLEDTMEVDDATASSLLDMNDNPTEQTQPVAVNKTRKKKVSPLRDYQSSSDSHPCSTVSVVSSPLEHPARAPSDFDWASEAPPEGAGRDLDEVDPKMSPSAQAEVETRIVEGSAKAPSPGPTSLSNQAKMATDIELESLIRRAEADLDSLKAEKAERIKKAKATARAKQEALTRNRREAGLTPKSTADRSLKFSEWPNYGVKGMRPAIARGDMEDFLISSGLPSHIVNDVSWTTLASLYGAVNVWLYSMGAINGIDERLDRGYFVMEMGARQVTNYMTWLVPALGEWLKDNGGGKVLPVVKPSPEILQSLTLAANPTATTPSRFHVTKKPRAMRERTGHVTPPQPKRKKSPVEASTAPPPSTSPAREEEAVAPVEETGVSGPTEVVTNQSSNSNKETSDATGRKPTKNVPVENSQAIFPSSDVRDKGEAETRENQRRSQVLNDWFRKVTDEGNEAESKVDIPSLMTSLKSTLAKAGVRPLGNDAVWKYARKVMEDIAPAQRQAGHYMGKKSSILKAAESAGEWKPMGVSVRKDKKVPQRTKAAPKKANDTRWKGKPKTNDNRPGQSKLREPTRSHVSKARPNDNRPRSKPSGTNDTRAEPFKVKQPYYKDFSWISNQRNPKKVGPPPGFEQHVKKKPPSSSSSPTPPPKK